MSIPGMAFAYSNHC